MSKIPKQRTGSGGWPDRRRAVTYNKGGKKSKGCAVLLIALLGGVATLSYGAAELINYIA